MSISNTSSTTSNEKLQEVQEVLLFSLEECSIALDKIEEALDTVKTAADILTVEEQANALIDLARILKEFPLKAQPPPRELPPEVDDPKVTSFLNRINVAYSIVRIKLFDVLKQFILSTTDLSSAITVAFILKDVKKTLAKFLRLENVGAHADKDDDSTPRLSLDDPIFNRNKSLNETVMQTAVNRVTNNLIQQDRTRAHSYGQQQPLPHTHHPQGQPQAQAQAQAQAQMQPAKQSQTTQPESPAVKNLIRKFSQSEVSSPSQPPRAAAPPPNKLWVNLAPRKAPSSGLSPAPLVDTDSETTYSSSPSSSIKIGSSASRNSPFLQSQGQFTSHSAPSSPMTAYSPSVLPSTSPSAPSPSSAPSSSQPSTTTTTPRRNSRSVVESLKEIEETIADNEVVASPEQVSARTQQAIERRRSTTIRRPPSVILNPAEEPKLSECLEDILIASDTVTLLGVIRDAQCLKLFRQFLKKEMSEETILFWLECDKFSQIVNGDSYILTRKACMIYDTFLKENTEHEVNVPGAMRKKIADSIRAGTIDLHSFESAKKHIFQLMESDPFRRFLESDLFKQHTKTQKFQKITTKKDRKKQKRANMDWILSLLESH